MLVPARYRHRNVYHITHIDNLPAILEQGLLSIRAKSGQPVGHRSIAHDSIQEQRHHRRVPCGSGGTIHDYVPFYFCRRSPMLNGVVYAGYAPQDEIIYLEVPITIMEKCSCVFTDASANANTPPHFYDDPQHLDLLDWDAIETWQWNSKHDRPGQLPVSQRKQAELLVHRSVAPSYIHQITVWNDEIADRVAHYFDAANLSAPLLHLGYRDYYFLDDRGFSSIPIRFSGRRVEERPVDWQFYLDYAPSSDESTFYFDARDWEVKPDPPHRAAESQGMQQSPLAGRLPIQGEQTPIATPGVPKPIEPSEVVTKPSYQLDSVGENRTSDDTTNASLQGTIHKILRRMGRATTPRFPKLKDLRDALRSDLSCLPETHDLTRIVIVDADGRKEFAGKHARKVVHALEELPEYSRMERGEWKTDQLLCTLAAFMQDIGY